LSQRLIAAAHPDDAAECCGVLERKLKTRIECDDIE
jgi:hypothetical protein